MSLTEPKWFETVWSWLKWKPVYISIACLLLLLFIWWALAAYQGHEKKKDIERAKANVNVALQKVANAQAVVSNDKANEAASVQEFHDAANTYVNMVNADDQQRAETNRAIANVDKAVNANVPVGTTVDDLHKLLDDLDKEP